MIMKRFSKWLLVTMSACIATTAFAFTSFAEETRTRITSLNVSIASSLQPGQGGGEITVTPNNEGYAVSNVEITNRKEVWAANDTPEVRVTFTANEGYYFPLTGEKVFLLSGRNAQYLDSSKSDDKTNLTLLMRLDHVGYNGLAISNASWGENYTAQWTPTYGADFYQVRLIRGVDAPEQIGSSVTTTDASYDFSSKIRKNGVYTFEVRAKADNYEPGAWVKSNVITVSNKTDTGEDMPGEADGASYATVSGPGFASLVGEWKKDETGWWFEKEDGTYPTNSWQIIESKWYCFDERGYMRTGWIQTDGKWYYTDDTGARLANTTTPDGYKLDSEGVWK